MYKIAYREEFGIEARQRSLTDNKALARYRRAAAKRAPKMSNKVKPESAKQLLENQRGMQKKAAHSAAHKIKAIVEELFKASDTHKGQAEKLQAILHSMQGKMEKKATYAEHKQMMDDDSRMLCKVLDSTAAQAIELKKKISMGMLLPSWAEYKVYKAGDSMKSALSSTYSLRDHMGGMHSPMHSPMPMHSPQPTMLQKQASLLRRKFLKKKLVRI